VHRPGHRAGHRPGARPWAGDEWRRLFALESGDRVCAAKRVVRGGHGRRRERQNVQMCKTRSYPMRTPGAPACVTLAAGTLEPASGNPLREAFARQSATIPCTDLGTDLGTDLTSGRAPVTNAGGCAAWKVAIRFVSASKRAARGVPAGVGRGKTCTMCKTRSYPMRQPGVPAWVTLKAGTGTCRRSGRPPCAANPTNRRTQRRITTPTTITY